MSEKYNNLLLERVEERVERVEEDVRSLQETKPTIERILVSTEYQQKLIEGIKETLDKQYEENKEVADRNLEQHNFQNKEIADLKTEVALLKQKSGMWGALGGIFAFLALLAVEFFKTLF